MPVDHGKPPVRRALCIHLFYPDIAIELVRRIEPLDPSIDVFVTGPRPFGARLSRALDRLPQRVEIVETGEGGFDVGPFLAALRIVAERDYDLVGKLHTKRGDLAFGERWRTACLDALVHSPPAVERLFTAFAEDPGITILGPGNLFISAKVNMLRNAAHVEALGAMCFPGKDLPDDWGFFAGTMFWARVAAMRPFLRLLDQGLKLASGLGMADGHRAHALERLFGLAGWPGQGKVANVWRSQGADLPTIIADSRPASVGIMDVLPGLGRPDAYRPATVAEQRFLKAINPLSFYIQSGRTADLDPHPLFNNRWYRQANPGIPDNQTPLGHFIRRGATALSPSPAFDIADYLRHNPWLRRVSRPIPLRHFLRQVGPPTDGPAGASAPLVSAGEAGALRVFIKSPASRHSVSEWGDQSFAEGLAAALSRRGWVVSVDCREDWYRTDRPTDLVIVIRGPVRYERRPGPAAILWNISHPDQVSFDEMETYDLVYVASQSYAALLRGIVAVPVRPLLQATDTDRFAFSTPRRDGKVLFVGNSRGQDRQTIRRAIEEGLAPQIYGFGWDELAPPDLVQGARLDNRLLAGRYAAAKAVLNDHWAAMRDFGYVNNRLLDVLAAGGVPISDRFAAVTDMLGKAFLSISDQRGLKKVVAEAAKRPVGTRRRFSEMVRRRHSFDERARSMSADLDRLKRGDDLSMPAARGRAKRRVVLFVAMANGHPHDLACARLLAPLTRDEAPISVTVCQVDDTIPPGHDLVIVQSDALADHRTAQRIVAEAAQRSMRLFLDDVGPAGRRLPTSRDPVSFLRENAFEVWVPAPPRRKRGTGGRTVVVPHAIDPRLWREYDRRWRYDASATDLRLLLLPGASIEAITAEVAALDQIADRHSISLTIAGEAAGLPRRKWITLVRPPAGSESYARRIGWLRSLRPFHIGLCCGSRDDPAAPAERLFLEYSALGLASLVSAEALTDHTVESEALALIAPAKDMSLAEQLGEVAKNPRPLAAVAAAAEAYVWKHRHAGIAAAVLKERLLSD